MVDLILIAGWSTLAIAVVVGCLVPADRLPRHLPNDKLLHLLSYAALALPVTTVASSPQYAITSAVILLLAGLLIELVQHFVPGRSFCKRDLLANTAGVLIGTLIGLVVPL